LIYFNIHNIKQQMLKFIRLKIIFITLLSFVVENFNKKMLIFS
jgi:hypothetical protein